jgi:hypothetical protein
MWLQIFHPKELNEMLKLLTVNINIQPCLTPFSCSTLRPMVVSVICIDASSRIQLRLIQLSSTKTRGGWGFHV